MKKGWLIAGIIVLLVTFFFAQLYLTPDMKSRINLADSLCTAKFDVLGLTIPAGEIGQEVLGEQQECRNAHYWSLVIDYAWIGYLIGAIFVVMGLLLGKKKIERKVSRSRRKVKRR